MTPVGSLDAEKRVEAVFFYVFTAFTASVLHFSCVSSEGDSKQLSYEMLTLLVCSASVTTALSDIAFGFRFLCQTQFSTFQTIGKLRVEKRKC